MIPALPSMRELLHRGGTTLMILLVALAATVAAAAGPVYYAAARYSTLADTVSGGPAIGRGFEANLTGPVSGTLPRLRSTVLGVLDGELGKADAARLFGTPVEAVQGIAFDRSQAGSFALAWRSGMCSRLRFTGTCPAGAGQVLVSASMAKVSGWHIGQRITGTGWRPLTVTGIYQTPDLTTDYWVLTGTTYFPLEEGRGGGRTSFTLDAMFTAQGTLASAPPAQQGIAFIDSFLRQGQCSRAMFPGCSPLWPGPPATGGWQSRG